ncbi:hypothetical protein CCM_06082 [Cordyceps militaris CM01]|uniref:Uncharacterized protein n=1 Tax=Cordyceps militaris (strain CM01) TaxID=983644 RepID=G3JIM5_CORMM|nr:uncharacterized protein CCM_06082 [Cordyceps militaris CM01]EGX91922.1 hypothetical protein CCM_06082 [Cordyceps militaris CM01]
MHLTKFFGTVALFFAAASAVQPRVVNLGDINRRRGPYNPTPPNSPSGKIVTNGEEDDE